MTNGEFFDEDYYDSLLAEIREIRLSERRFYQKVTDIYATSIDYDRNSKTTLDFLKKSSKKYIMLFLVIQPLKQFIIEPMQVRNIWG